MDELLFVPDIMERYHVSDRTARKYMYRMRHMVKPLSVTPEAVREWEESRTVDPTSIAMEKGRKKVQRAVRSIPEDDGKFLIPRKRPKVVGG